MDPLACLLRLDQAITDKDLSDAKQALDDYRQWRAKGGFEPEHCEPQNCAPGRGDAVMQLLAEKLAEEPDVNGLDKFTRSYVEAALWSSTDNADESGGEPLDKNHEPEDIAPKSLAKMIEDCKTFQEANAELLARAGDDSRNGHDYWLTRNRHGAGFWDRGYDSEVGKELTDAAQADGECDLYIGDDGKIYQS